MHGVRTLGKSRKKISWRPKQPTWLWTVGVKKFPLGLLLKVLGLAIVLGIFFRPLNFILRAALAEPANVLFGTPHSEFGIKFGEKKAVSPPAPVSPFRAASLQTDYSAEPLSGPWKPMPSLVTLHPAPNKQGEVAPIYTGINAAGVEGGELITNYPQTVVCRGNNLQIGQEGAWQILENKRDFPVTSWRALFIQGSRPVHMGPGTVTIQVEHPKDRVRIATFAQADSNVTPVLRWGKLPDPAKYTWQVYVRYANSDGSPLAPQDLMAYRGVISISGRGTPLEEVVTQSETTLPSSSFSGRGEPTLVLGVPKVASSIRVEVIVVIAPK